MMKVAVLGGGRVGSAIARDLAADDNFNVTVSDLDPSVAEEFGAEEGIETIRVDLSVTGSVAETVRESDIVVCAVPGFMGFSTVEQVILAGKDVVDISFFPEDALLLDGQARENGVRCLVDFGIAPGCSNLFFGHIESTFGRVDRFECYVGGLPVERNLPWEYQAPFSPVDVLEEYTRPARYIEEGRIVTKPALSDPELMNFQGVGTLEAFLTDGLRTLLRAGNVPEMVEKTLRYPGYIEKILLLRETGFLDSDPILVDGQSVAPLSMTSELLFPAWQQRPGDEDFTVMRITATGTDRDGSPLSKTWNLLDRYDRKTVTTSMARTTGYSCTAGVRMLAGGLWKETGVSPPEYVGRKASCFRFIMDDLKKRNVVFSETV